MEKLIDELKIIETDDGFRIEIKGDKEAIRKMLVGFEAGFPHDFHFSFDPGFWNNCMGWCGFWQGAGDQNKKA